MNPRERYIATVTGQPVDRPPYYIFWGPWGPTWERWKTEGVPFANWGEFRASFDPDPGPEVVTVNCGTCPRIKTETLADDGQYITWRDSWGITRRNPKNSESMSEFLKYPVETRRDWEEFAEKYLNPDDPARLAGDWLAKARANVARGVPLQLGHYPDVGVFGVPRWLLGDEEALVRFISEPDLIHDMMERMTDIYVTVFEAVASVVRVDVIHIWEDMAGKQGPLIGPRHFREFMTPCYNRIKALARRHNIPVMSVDTDGWPHPIVPEMMDAGVNMILPWEVAAGCDVNAVQKQFPGLGLLGGIDKRALAVSPEAIDKELARVRPAVAAGRYIPELDHLVPSDVPWQNYAHYAKGLKRLVGKE
jgi:uroporphyrinogen decarboxylase